MKAICRASGERARAERQAKRRVVCGTSPRRSRARKSASGRYRTDADASRTPCPKPAALFRREHILYAHTEERRDTKREREARVVFFVLERVHGLTRDLEPVSELALRPVALRAQDAKAIFHR